MLERVATDSAFLSVGFSPGKKSTVRKALTVVTLYDRGIIPPSLRTDGLHIGPHC